MSPTGPVLFIVDDEPEVLRALERIFEWSYRVNVFDNAFAARAAIGLRPPQLVISDNYMPKVEGLTFLREVRRAFPQIRTLLLTGGYINERIQRALATGEIDALCTKPWNLHDLTRRVRELVERSTP